MIRNRVCCMSVCSAVFRSVSPVDGADDEQPENGGRLNDGVRLGYTGHTVFRGELVAPLNGSGEWHGPAECNSWPGSATVVTGLLLSAYPRRGEDRARNPAPTAGAGAPPTHSALTTLGLNCGVRVISATRSYSAVGVARMTRLTSPWSSCCRIAGCPPGSIWTGCGP